MAEDYVPIEDTLLYHSVAPHFAPVIRKGMWGSPYVSVPDLIAVKFRTFEIGSVIGVSMRSRLRAVVRMLGRSAGHDELLDDLLAEGESQTAEALQLAPGDGYESLLDLFLFLEFEARGSPVDALLRWGKKKVDLELAVELACIPFMKGLGIGAVSPEVIQDLWRKTWETPNRANWAAAQDKGLPVSAPEAGQTFEDRVEEVTESVRALADAYFPDLQGYVGTLVSEVSTEVRDEGASHCITLHGIQDWAFTADYSQLLCPGCIEKKLDDDRLLLVDGQVRYKEGPSVFEPDTDLALQLAYMDDLEYLEPLSRAWPRRSFLQPYRPVPTPRKPWRCDRCRRRIRVTAA